MYLFMFSFSESIVKGSNLKLYDQEKAYRSCKFRGILFMFFGFVFVVLVVHFFISDVFIYVFF